MSEPPTPNRIRGSAACSLLKTVDGEQLGSWGGTHASGTHVASVCWCQAVESLPEE